MIRKIDFNSEYFISFLKSIEMPYEKGNNSFFKKPWTYRKYNNFFFKCFILKKRIVAVMIYSKHRYNFHLNFIYVSKENRNKKVGFKLLKYFLSLKSKNFFTAHVNKKSKKTINFYEKNLFKKYLVSQKIEEVEYFKSQSEVFNKNVYKKKYLFFYKK